MARYTDTRALVRKAAQDIDRSGQVPTPSLIRGILGTGSMNTIVDELRRWREAQGPVFKQSVALPALELSASTQEALKLVSLAEVQEVLGSVQEALLSQAKSTAALQERLVAREEQDAQVQEALSQAVGLIRETNASHAAALALIATSLEKVSSRFEGVQRHMLLQVNEAREHASAWKDKHLASKLDFATWRDVLQAQVLRLTEELAWTKGSAGVPPGAKGFCSSPIVRPGPAAVARPRPLLPPAPSPAASPYPGHPRAAPAWDESPE